MPVVKLLAKPFEFTGNLRLRHTISGDSKELRRPWGRKRFPLQVSSTINLAKLTQLCDNSPNLCRKLVSGFFRIVV